MSIGRHLVRRIRLCQEQLIGLATAAARSLEAQCTSVTGLSFSYSSSQAPCHGVRGLVSSSWTPWQPEQPGLRQPFSTRGKAQPGGNVDVEVEEGAADAAGAPGAAAAEQEAAAASVGETPGPSGAEGTSRNAQAAQQQAALDAKDKEVRDLRERNLRVLADMENLRERSAKAAQSTKQFAIQGFVKDVVEVADNLQRAAEMVPESVLQGTDADGQPLTPERALALLQSLLQGVHLTERVLQQTLKKNGVERYAPKQGDDFDHDLHNAMFDVPAPPGQSGEDVDAGRIAMLIKNGYTLNGRVIRPADVATFRAPA